MPVKAFKSIQLISILIGYHTMHSVRVTPYTEYSQYNQDHFGEDINFTQNF